MRVHEIARALGVLSKDVREQLANVGIATRSSSSFVQPIAARAFIATRTR